MKKIYLGLTIAALLTGCASTEQTGSVASEITKSTLISTTAGNLILDPQLTEFRNNSGNSDVWKKSANKNAGLGDAGSSKDTAFDDEGSSRLRFVSSTDDFTAQPGLSQAVVGLQPNTDYEFSVYYNDKKGDESISELVFGANGMAGDSLAMKTIHITELVNAPQGRVKKGFRQALVSFNSGSNAVVTVYAKLHITDPSKIDTSGDIGGQTEVRIDEFKLSKK